MDGYHPLLNLVFPAADTGKAFQVFGIDNPLTQRDPKSRDRDQARHPGDPPASVILKVTICQYF